VSKLNLMPKLVNVSSILDRTDIIWKW